MQLLGSLSFLTLFTPNLNSPVPLPSPLWSVLAHGHGLALLQLGLRVCLCAVGRVGWTGCRQPAGSVGQGAVLQPSSSEGERLICTSHRVQWISLVFVASVCQLGLKCVDGLKHGWTQGQRSPLNLILSGEQETWLSVWL